jgi:hypothetical protein
VADDSFTHLVVVGSSAGGIGALSGLVFSLVKERAALLKGAAESYSSLQGGAQVRFPLRNGGG